MYSSTEGDSWQYFFPNSSRETHRQTIRLTPFLAQVHRLYANQTLANVIWYVLLAVVVLSWVISLVRKVRGILLRRREDKMLELIVLNRMREAQMYGEPEPDGGYKIQVDDLIDDD